MNDRQREKWSCYPHLHRSSVLIICHPLIFRSTLFHRPRIADNSVHAVIQLLLLNISVD